MLSVFLWVTTNSMKVDNVEMEVNIAQLEEDGDAIEKIVSTAELTPGLIKQVVNLYDVISENNHHFDDVLMDISVAKRGYSDITIEEVELLAKKATIEGGSDEMEGMYALLKTSSDFLLSISFAADLGDRRILQRLEGFIIELRKQPNIKTAKKEKSSIDVSSAAELKGGVEENIATKASITFSIRLSI